MARRLYVYYRVAEADLGRTVVAVRSMQQALVAANPGLQAGLLRRPELRDGQLTLMETYAGAVAPALAGLLADAAAALPQPRHAEWFDTLDEPEPR
ncbi:MAG: DUF4936 family protein [Burkholderiaceae bacterium]|nr:DUF4936 family protein [Burkholderiaceae bacterium]